MPHSDQAMINRLLPSFELEVACFEWQLEMLISERGWHHRSCCLHLTPKCHTSVVVRLRFVVLQALHLDICEFLECLHPVEVSLPFKLHTNANQSSFAIPPQPIPCGTICSSLRCKPPSLCEKGIGILGCITPRSLDFRKTSNLPYSPSGEQGTGLV